MKVVEEIVKRTYADNGYWLPPSEVQPLVRCKDCKHRFNGCCYNKASNKINFGVYVAYDWFCADGQKK